MPSCLRFVPPAIDPLSTKNLDLDEDLYCRVLVELGISLRKPVLLQVSRFDPWKDPLGVIRAFHLVKQEIPALQLVLAGGIDRKSTRLNSSHRCISYAVFCLKKKNDCTYAVFQPRPSITPDA